MTTSCQIINLKPLDYGVPLGTKISIYVCGRYFLTKPGDLSKHYKKTIGTVIGKDTRHNVSNVLVSLDDGCSAGTKLSMGRILDTDIVVPNIGAYVGKPAFWEKANCILIEEKDKFCAVCNDKISHSLADICIICSAINEIGYL
jgi:hypothetical protein